MLNQPTFEKLYTMKLKGMADAFREQLETTTASQLSFEERFGLHTVSFHLGTESATIDLEGGAVEARTVLDAERRTNDLVFANLPVTVTFEDSKQVQGLRKPSEREGTLRIVSIGGGTGLATLLRGLKRYSRATQGAVEITGIVTV